MEKGSIVNKALTADRVKLTVYNPTGAFEITQLYAHRPMDLSGKVICELSNGIWKDVRTFGFIRTLLRKRFPDTRLIPFTEFPIGTEQIDKESTVDMVMNEGCQAVIISPHCFNFAENEGSREIDTINFGTSVKKYII